MAILKILSAVVLTLTFWSSLRVYSISIFDIGAGFTALAAIITTKVTDTRYSLANIKALIVGCILLTLASGLSTLMSPDELGHLEKAAKVVFSMVVMVTLCHALASRSILRFSTVIKLLCLSATVHSIVCIMQGKFGLLTGLAFKSEYDIQTWSRFPGLSEHPIEAGYVSVFGMVFFLWLRQRRHIGLFTFGLAAVINTLALKYSGSLTAVVALFASVLIFAFYSKSVQSFLLLALLLGVFTASIFYSSDFNPLISRIEKFSKTGSDYSTLRSRELQVTNIINRIDVATVLLGQGYFSKSRDAEIHNTLIAALYHLGLLGLTSQFAFLFFFTKHSFGRANFPDQKALMISCFSVFLAAYMTGPSLSRRSLWMPVLLISVSFARKAAQKTFAARCSHQELICTEPSTSAPSSS